MSDLAPKLSIQNLKKVYAPDIIALQDVSFDVYPGEVLGLIGMSGCGKTTLLKSINRLIDPDQGQILLDGQSIYDMDLFQLRRGMGYVVQHGGLLPHMSVARNIGIMQELAGNNPQIITHEVHQLMELTHLEPGRFANRYPRELSGGQQQRVGIARALMGKPPILLMDEPFSALDPITRNHLQREFRELQRQLNTTTVLVTHDLIEAFRLCDPIMLMQQGKVIQIGSKQDLLHHPANDFVKDFVISQIEGIQEEVHA